MRRHLCLCDLVEGHEGVDREVCEAEADVLELDRYLPATPTATRTAISNTGRSEAVGGLRLTKKKKKTSGTSRSLSSLTSHGARTRRTYSPGCRRSLTAEPPKLPPARVAAVRQSSTRDLLRTPDHPATCHSTAAAEAPAEER